jgi:hypothetical protein
MVERADDITDLSRDDLMGTHGECGNLQMRPEPNCVTSRLCQGRKQTPTLDVVYDVCFSLHMSQTRAKRIHDDLCNTNGQDSLKYGK